MISNRKIREYIRGRIDSDTTLDLNNFAWENRQFDASDKPLYFVERLVVTTERITTNEESAKWGIMYYDVIVNRGAGTEDQDDNAKILADVFNPADNKELEIESGLKINIDEATVGNRSDFTDSRVQLPVRIEFRAYEVE